MQSVQEVVARLAGGSQGRTEADIQADVRQFLLEAPLELSHEQVQTVSLETHIGGGQRIDVEAGYAAIEVKKDLGSQTVFNAAVAQLTSYVRQRQEQRSERYVGVLTDGRTWVLLHLRPDDMLAEVDRLTLHNRDDAARLAAWLESILATTARITPTPTEIIARLGANSPAAQLDLADLQALYAACKNRPRSAAQT